MTRTVTLLIICSFLFLRPAAGLTQTAFYIGIDDPAYLHLETLANAGLLENDHLSSKPIKTNIFRHVLPGSKNYTRDKAFDDRIRYSLAYLKARFKLDEKTNGHHLPYFKFVPVQNFSVEYFHNNTAQRLLPETYIDALVSEPTSYRQGHTYHQGHNLYFEAGHGLTASNWLSVYFSGRGQVYQSPGRTENRIAYEAHRYYLSFHLWNLSLLVGRDNIVWGTGSRGNLILSSNAGPVGSFDSLPLIKLENDRSLRLPWKFRVLGPMKFVLFISKLEQNRRDFARPYFIGSRLSFQPSRQVEYSFSHTYIMGGNDFPTSFSFWEGLAEFFFIRIKQNFIFNIDIGEVTLRDNIANHVMGFDLRLRFPWRNLEVFSEFYFDDLTLNLKTTLERNLAYYGGFWLPRLTANGRLGLRGEYTHTSRVFYAGTPPLTSGYTYNRRILGSALGPFGDELFLELTFRPKWHISISPMMNFQSRGIGEESGVNHEGAKNEVRWLFGSNITSQLTNGLRLKLAFGFERISNFNNAPGNHSGFWGGMSFNMNHIF